MEDLIATMAGQIVSYVSTSDIPTVSLLATSAIAVSAVVARELDAPKESSGWLYKLAYKVINKLAMNSKKAINADDFLAKRK